MKRYNKLFVIIALAALGLSGCRDLDLNESQYHTKTFLFGNFSEVKDMMTNVYGYLKSGFLSFQECATDDAVYANSPDIVLPYYDGSWSENNLIDDQWGYYYEAIRAANYLIENCPEDFADAKWDERYKDYLAQLQNYPWEARALRAFFHMELLKRYNNIVKADRTFTKEEVNDLVPSTNGEIVNWIVSELDSCIEHLPSTYSDSYYAEIGRVTKGFAMAAKARVLLYAASPLSNPSNDKEKYYKAAAAASQFINSTSEKAVYGLARQNFNSEAKDLIFGIREVSDNNYEKNNFPAGYEGGLSGICPTLNLAEAFDLVDGTPFDESLHMANLLNPSSRDPRYAKAIISNGDLFKGQTVETFEGGRNGSPVENASPTSFYLRKFVQEATSLTAGNITSYPHIYPVFRVQEVYLNYAEALFEATGNPEYTGTIGGVSYTLSPRAALNKIRAVYSMPDIPAGLTEAQFRARLRNERRVELCFEGHRMWDLRRWKTGNLTVDIYGLNIVKNGDDSFSCTKKKVQTRYWDDKMLWYPISAVELHKNPNLNQNTGWN